MVRLLVHCKARRVLRPSRRIDGISLPCASTALHRELGRVHGELDGVGCRARQGCDTALPPPWRDAGVRRRSWLVSSVRRRADGVAGVPGRDDVVVQLFPGPDDAWPCFSTRRLIQIMTPADFDGLGKAPSGSTEAHLLVQLSVLLLETHAAALGETGGILTK